MKHAATFILFAGMILNVLGADQIPPLQVVSLSTVLTEVAQKVGGDQVQVIGLLKPGMDPHTFEPQPSDVVAVSKADLVLASGKGMEGYLDKLKESAGVKAVWLEVGNQFASIKLQQSTPEPAMKQAGHVHRGVDPHWWHSVANVEEATQIVCDALTQLRPESKDYFRARAAEYSANLDQLYKWIQLEIALLPRDLRKLVTSHDAFQYFARDFGFTIYSISGINSEDQPSSQKIADLIDTIREQKVKAVFFENIENPKVIAEITKETGAIVGGELYADGLGTGEASTYDGMMKHNVRTIVEALK